MHLRVKGLNFSIACENLDYTNYLVNFENYLRQFA